MEWIVTILISIVGLLFWGRNRKLESRLNQMEKKEIQEKFNVIDEKAKAFGNRSTDDGIEWIKQRYRRRDRNNEDPEK